MRKRSPSESKRGERRSARASTPLQRLRATLLVDKLTFGSHRISYGASSSSSVSSSSSGSLFTLPCKRVMGSRSYLEEQEAACPYEEEEEEAPPFWSSARAEVERTRENAREHQLLLQAVEYGEGAFAGGQEAPAPKLSGFSHSFVRELRASQPNAAQLDYCEVLRWIQARPVATELEREDKRLMFEALFIMFTAASERIALRLLELEAEDVSARVCGSLVFHFTRVRKAASMEVDATQALLDVAFPEINFALVAVFSSRTRRIMVHSKTPTAGQFTLVQGQLTEEGGLVKPPAWVHTLLSTLGRQLGVGEGPYGIMGPFDMQVHKAEGRLYISHMARLFPSYPRAEDPVYASFRPELVARHKHAIGLLISDSMHPETVATATLDRRDVRAMQASVFELEEKLLEDVAQLDDDTLPSLEELHARGIHRRAYPNLVARQYSAPYKRLHAPRNPEDCDVERLSALIAALDGQPLAPLVSLYPRLKLGSLSGPVTSLRRDRAGRMWRFDAQAHPLLRALDIALSVDRQYALAKVRGVICVSEWEPLTLEVLLALMRHDGAQDFRDDFEDHVLRQCGEEAHLYRETHALRTLERLAEEGLWQDLLLVAKWAPDDALRLLCRGGQVELVQQCLEGRPHPPELVTWALEGRIVDELGLEYSASEMLLVGASNGCLDYVQRALAPSSEALQAAADAAHLQIARVLLEAGAELRCCYSPSLELTRILLDAGAPLERSLWLAATRDDVEGALFLLSRGADPNEVHADETALHVSVRRRCLEMARVLVEAGANVNATNALYSCAASGDMEVLRFLLAQKKIHVDAVPAPLEAACRYNHFDAAKLLLEKGARVDGGTGLVSMPLRSAVFNGNAKLVALLLEHGSPAAATHLKLACHSGHSEVASLLLDANCAVSPDMAQDACRQGHSDVASLLLNTGAVRRPGPLLHIAAQEGHQLVTQVLLGRVDIDEPDMAGRTALWLAASRGHKNVVELLVSGCANINARNSEGLSSLGAAALFGQTPSMELLIFMGCDVDASSLEAACRSGSVDAAALLLERGAVANNATAVVAACQGGHKQLVELLIERKADIDARDPQSGLSPLESACSTGCSDVVFVLLEHGVHVSRENTKMLLNFLNMQDGHHLQSNLLHRAAELGLVLLVRALVNEGAVLDARDSRGRTPLHWACEGNQGAMVDYLLAHNDALRSIKALDFGGNACIHAAVVRGNVSIVERLVSVDPELAMMRDGYQNSPLAIASRMGHEELVRSLLTQYTWRDNVNETNDDKETPLMLAASGPTSLLQLLLHSDADVNAVSADGGTALIRATLRNQTDNARLLMQRGADWSREDQQARHAVLTAASRGYFELLHMYLDEFGVPMTACNEAGETVMHKLARLPTMVHLRFSAVPDVNVADCRGRTPLHVAAQSGLTEVAKHLLEFNARIDERDDSQNTPLHFACSSSCLPMVSLLVDYGASLAARDTNGLTPGQLAHNKPAVLAQLERQRSRATCCVYCECSDERAWHHRFCPSCFHIKEAHGACPKSYVRLQVEHFPRRVLAFLGVDDLLTLRFTCRQFFSLADADEGLWAAVAVRHVSFAMESAQQRELFFPQVCDGDWRSLALTMCRMLTVRCAPLALPTFSVISLPWLLVSRCMGLPSVRRDVLSYVRLDYADDARVLRAQGVTCEEVLARFRGRDVLKISLFGAALREPKMDSACLPQLIATCKKEEMATTLRRILDTSAGTPSVAYSLVCSSSGTVSLFYSRLNKEPRALVSSITALKAFHQYE